MPNPIYHQLAFGGIMLTCVSRNIVLIRRLPKQPQSQSQPQSTVPIANTVGSAKQGQDQQGVEGVKGKGKDGKAIIGVKRNARSKISLTLLQGVLTFIAGFAIWNVDNVFCDQLRYGRAVMAEYGVGGLGFILQGEYPVRMLKGFVSNSPRWAAKTESLRSLLLHSSVHPLGFRMI